MIRSDRSIDILVVAPLVGFILWLVARLAQRAFRNFPPVQEAFPSLAIFSISRIMIGWRHHDARTNTV